MIKKLFPYICLISLCLSASCAHDEFNLNDDSSDNELHTYTIPINIIPDFAAEMTRAVDMTPNSFVRLGEVWIGIYNAGSGAIIKKDTLSLNYRAVPAGTEYMNAININFTATGNPNICVVAVTNYNDVEAISVNSDGSVTESPLLDVLQAATTWEKFRNISVDTKSAYAGEKGTTTPLLMGYLVEKSLPDVIRVNQFSNDNVNLNSTGGTFAANANMDNKFLRLRRLVSQVTVNLEAGDGISLSNVRYKKVNIPKAVYLTERLTDDHSDSRCAEGSDDASYSSNIADLSPINLYDSDNDWIAANSSKQFSFQHFENKHWARNDLYNYNNRETTNDDGSFKALASSVEDANNYATYILLSMHVSDEVNGISADVEYRIHEGYCCDENGNALYVNGAITNLTKILKDYSCIRNTNYNYNIRINGVNSIELSVTKSEQHAEGQKGDIYRMRYPEGVTSAGMNPNSFTTDSGMKFNSISARGLAFRIYLEDENRNIYDYYYNFTPFDSWTVNYSDLWPGFSSFSQQITSEDLKDDEFINSLPEPLSELLDDMLVRSGEDYIDVFEFIKTAESENDYGFWANNYIFDQSLIENRKDFLRAIYIFDPQQFDPQQFEEEKPLNTDEDGCALYEIFAFEQYPYIDNEVPQLKTPRISMTGVPGNSFVVGLNDHTIEIEPVQGADTYIFTITGNGADYTEIRTINDEGYFSVESSKITDPSKKTGNETTENQRFRYVNKYGKNLYLYSVFYGASKGGLMSLTSGNTYQFTVKAVDSTGKRRDSEESSITKTVYLPTWNFSQSPWTSITPLSNPNERTDLGNGWEKTDKGLTVARGNNSLVYSTINNTYGYAFYTGGAGSYISHSSYSRVFKFHAVTSGKVGAIASNTANSLANDRYIEVWANGLPQRSSTNSGTATSSPATTKDLLDMTPDFRVADDIENYAVYSTANLYIYQISFTPTGDSRPFHKGVDDQ